MKYILKAIGYLIAWVLLTAWITIERSVKLFVVFFQIIWHLNFKKDWLKIFDDYFISIPIPIFMVYSSWTVKTLKDVYLLRNYEEID